MLNEHDLQEFYEEQLKESQQRKDAQTKSQQDRINRKIDLLQELIVIHKKLWGV